MTKPKTYAELREQWLQQTVKEGPGPVDDLAALAELIRPAFQAAIERLRELLQDPERDREAVMAALRPFGLARMIVSPEDIPALIELARTARRMRGPGSHDAEREILGALVELADESVLSFLVECFQFSRPRDSSAGYRRKIVLKGIAAIALLSRNEEALDLLDEALTYRLWRVRWAACRAIREVATMSDEGLPPRLEQQLRHLAQHDRAQKVRVSAELALAEGRCAPE